MTGGWGAFLRGVGLKCEKTHKDAFKNDVHYIFLVIFEPLALSVTFLYGMSLTSVLKPSFC